MGVQVLQRYEDPGANQMVDSIQKAQESMNETKKVQGYLLQLKLQAQAAQDEKEKEKYKRKYDMTKLLVEAKDKGLSAQALQAIARVHGQDDAGGVVTDLADFMGKDEETPENQYKRGQAKEANASGALQQAGADRFSGAGGQGSPMGGGAGRGGLLMPKMTIKGMEIINPEDAAAEVTNTTRAKNLEDLKSRTLTTDERATLQAQSQIETVLGRLETMKTPEGLPAQVAASLGNPFLANQAGKEVGDYSAQISKLKALIPFARGGKALTGTEAKRVDILLNPAGKTDEQQVQDLQDFRAEFLYGADLTTGGATAIKRPSTQVGRFIVREK